MSLESAVESSSARNCCSTTTAASVDSVWAVLADGWSYPTWVVGAARMRTVSADWPRVGAFIEHSVGCWPVLLDDRTVVMTCTPGRTLTLRGKTRPLGEVNIGFELTSTSAGGCTILMTEDVATGPGLAVPRMVRDPLIRMRNIETLQRLRLLAERNDS